LIVASDLMYPEPYEALKNLTRGNVHITKDVIYQFVDGLSINDDIKNEIKAITPHNYVGYTF
jgi:adenylosuccinate lyase